MEGYEIFMLVAGIVLILSSIVLVVIVLIQSNSAKGLSGAIAGGSETFYGKNKKKSIEKKLMIVTIVVTIVFALTSLGIASFQKNLKTQQDEYNDWLQSWYESVFGTNSNVQINTGSDDHSGHDHD